MAKTTSELVEKARADRNKGNYDEVIKFYNEALNSIPDDNKLDKANLNSEVGLFLDELGNSQEGITYHTAALELFKTLGNESNIADSNYNLCISLINNEKAADAIQYADDALKYYETEKNDAAIADCLYALGLAYSMNSEIEKATEYLKKAIKSYKKLGQNEGMSSALLDLGNIYLDEDQFDKAIKQFKTAEKIFSESNDFGGVGDSKTCIARVYETKEDPPRSSTNYVDAAESYIGAELFDLAKDNLEIVENTLMSLPKATRKRLRNRVWDLKAKLPKKEAK